ncbi:MAG: N-acetylmuramoyl-L-alanine amidase [Phycisphaeraceae bacterium]|nr:N-acetylmuramoyl-L-alanine amidase [Phycisphaeraceae bacterium]MCW5753523.1 N-acetylmuramoyl-L-alanine amidase [Phycisphaeraceae bacterium]
MTTPNRRQVLGTMLTLFGAAAVSGCASSGQRTAGAGGVPIPSADDDLSFPPPNGNKGQQLLDQWNARRNASVAPPAGVLPRHAWARQGPVMRLANPIGRITRITVHHDGMSPFSSSSQADAANRLESIRRAHVGQGWADIGYHFAIDPSGRVWEGRPLELQGAHVKDYNDQNLGILVLGNFMEMRPTSQALSTLGGFVASQMRRFNVPVSRVYTHQELRPTACPGVHLQRSMLDMRTRTGPLAMA